MQTLAQKVFQFRKKRPFGSRSVKWKYHFYNFAVPDTLQNR